MFALQRKVVRALLTDAPIHRAGSIRWAEVHILRVATQRVEILWRLKVSPQTPFYAPEAAITVTVPDHEGIKLLTTGVTVAQSRLLPRC